MSKSVKAVRMSDRRFDVVTPYRTYYFKGLDSASADEWVAAINSAIEKYCK